MKSKGFTLIELLVAVTIFTVVVLLAIGALLNLSHVNDRSQTLLVALENLDFAMEQMSRIVRTGATYDCAANFPTPVPTDCASSGNNKISFKDQNDRSVRFQLINNTIVKERTSITGAPELPIEVTAPEIIIEDLTFFVVGTGAFNDGDREQPRVLITLRGRTNIFGFKLEEQADFNLQTTVTQRQPDE